MTLSKKKTKTAFLKRVSWSLALIVWNIPLPLREAFKQHRTSKKSSENSDVVKVSRENHEDFFSLRSFRYLIWADQDSLFSRLKEKKRKNNWWDNCVQPSTNKEERICIKSQPLAARDKEK